MTIELMQKLLITDDVAETAGGAGLDAWIFEMVEPLPFRVDHDY